MCKSVQTTINQAQFIGRTAQHIYHVIVFAVSLSGEDGKYC